MYVLQSPSYLLEHVVLDFSADTESSKCLVKYWEHDSGAYCMYSQTRDVYAGRQDFNWYAPNMKTIPVGLHCNKTQIISLAMLLNPFESQRWI